MCHTNFVVNEETGSFSEVVRHAVSQLFKTRRRFLKAAVYSVYIVLFLRRFHVAIRYFAKALQKTVKVQLNFYHQLWQLTKDVTDKLKTSPKSMLSTFRICTEYYIKAIFAIFGLLETTEGGKVPQLPSKKKIMYFLLKKFIYAITLSYNFFVMT